MLAQSRIRYNGAAIQVQLDLIPALPHNWPAGRVKGIRAKGNLELAFSWQAGRIVSLIIRNYGKAATVTIRAPGLECREQALESGETLELISG